MSPSASASGAVRGIGKQQCVTDAQPIGRAEIADLLEQHDQVWHW